MPVGQSSAAGSVQRVVDSVGSRNALAEGSNNRRLYIGLLTFVCAVFLLRAWFLIPTHDDGVIGNTVLGTPYYSEYHELYVPFYKPLITALMPVRFVSHPASFALVVLIHGLIMGASAYVTYLIARRYVPTQVAIGSGAIALYVLFTLDPLPPMRPEGLLLLTVLVVVYLADTWRLKREAKYLLAAGALTGSLALPMHTNASIAYLFLAFFALWHVRSLGSRDWACLVGALVISSIVGLAILLAPAPSDLPKLFAEYAAERHRFTFIVGEVRRFTFLLRPSPLLPVVLFFGTVGLVVLLRERARIAPELSGFVRRYPTLLMLGFATFFALAFLPSAEWGHYLPYYVPALAVFASVAYEHHRPSLGVGIAVGGLVVAAISMEAAALYLLREQMEAWVLTGLASGAIAGVLLCVSWVSGRREWLAAALILGVIIRLGLMAADHEAHSDIVDAIRARSAEVGGMVLGPPELIWAFARDEFHPVEHDWNEVPPAGTGIAATRERSTNPDWHERCIFNDIEPIPMSSFVSNRFRGGLGHQWEISTIVCEDP